MPLRKFFRSLGIALMLAVLALVSACGPRRTAKAVTLTVWGVWTDRPEVLEAMIRDYTARTGTRIKWEPAGQDRGEYDRRLQAAADAGLPDILELSGAELAAGIVPVEKLLPRSEIFDRGPDAWRSEFYPRALEAFAVPAAPGGTVTAAGRAAVPWTLYNYQVLCNRELCLQAGVDPGLPPKTWQDLLALGEEIRDAGLSPLLAGFGDPEIAYRFFTACCRAYLGAEGLRRLYAGQMPYTHPLCVQALQRVADLRDHNLLAPASLELTGPEAEQAFAGGLAALLWSGPGAAQACRNRNPAVRPDLFPLPKPADAAYDPGLPGGIARGCAVAATTRQPAQASDFLRWLTSRKQQVRLAEALAEIPANRNAEPGLDPVLQEFARGVPRITADPIPAERPEVRAVLTRGIRAILLGEAEPAEILEEARRAKQKLAQP